MQQRKSGVKGLQGWVLGVPIKYRPLTEIQVQWDSSLDLWKGGWNVCTTTVRRSKKRDYATVLSLQSTNGGPCLL
jgi:hypothetical protein